MRERLHRLEKTAVGAIVFLALTLAGSSYIAPSVREAAAQEPFADGVTEMSDLCEQELEDAATRLAARLPRVDGDKVLPYMWNMLDNGFVIIPERICVDTISRTGEYVSWESSPEGSISVVVLGHEGPRYDHDGTWVQGFLPGVGDGDPVWIDMSSVYEETFPFSFGEHTDHLANILGVETSGK